MAVTFHSEDVEGRDHRLHSILNSGYGIWVEEQPNAVESEPQPQLMRMSNGEEAVPTAKLLQPDLLILDISLPDSSGWEVATAIKRILPEIPILLLSAYGGKQLSDEVKKRGFQGFISKNDATKTLLGAVNAIVLLKQSFYS
jgi:DNA-binding NarL/FixJ family response regulator